MNQLENCQARYRSNTWNGRTRTDGPDEFEPSKFDCICIIYDKYISNTEYDYNTTIIQMGLKMFPSTLHIMTYEPETF